MPETKGKGRAPRNRRNNRNKKYQKPDVSDVTEGVKKMGMKNNAPKAPQASVTAPKSASFTPAQSALRNLLTEIVTKCGGKTVDEEGTKAIEQFDAALTTAELIVASDVTSMIVGDLLKSKTGAAREAGCKLVTVIAKKLGESVVPSLFAMGGIVLALCGDKKSKEVREAADVAASAVFECVPAPAVPVFVKRLEGDNVAILQDGKQRLRH